METQILILLLFALRTGSGLLTSIPPAPTLPNLDISSFPEYMQRMLANRPSLIYVNKPNNNRAQNENILHDNNVNYQIPGANIGIPRTNGMNPRNNQGYSDHINNVKSEPLYVPQAVRKPHTYGMNLRGDKGEIWNDLTGRHLYINDFAPSKSIHPNLLHNKEDEPSNQSTTNNNKYKIPEQMDDQKQKLPSATTVKPATLKNVPAIVEVPNYNNINDSYHPSNSNLKSANLYYVAHEPLSEEIPAIVESEQEEKVNQVDHSHQVFPSISSSKPEPYHMTAQPAEGIPANLVVQEDKNDYHIDHDSHQTFPSISTGKPDILYHNISPQPLSDKSSAILEVIKDKNVNQNDGNFPPNSTGKPDVPYHTNPQSLSEEVPTIVDEYDNSANTTENENTTEISKESIGNINLRDKIERSFDYINDKIGSNKEIKINQLQKSYGMKLAGDHGYVWNDMTKPGIHYNVGQLDISVTTNPTTEEEINPSEIPTEIPSFHEQDNGSNVVTEGPTDSSTANINGEPSTERTTPETFHINPTTESNHINEQIKPSKTITPELNASLKKYIDKLVKEEVARQLGRNDTKIDTNKNKACENNSDVLESNKTPATNTESSSGHNNYGSIIGNGKVTNLFVFYPNDQNRKPIVSNEPMILNKPVNDILDDMLNNYKTKNMPDSDVSIVGKSAITTKSAIMPINTEPSQQGTNSGIAIDMHIARFKDEEIITPSTAVTSEVNVTTYEGAEIDTENQTAQTTIAVQDNATQANTSDNESTTVNPITESSIDDIKTNATETESSSTESAPNSSVQEIENNNATTQATSISDEAVELTKNAEETNNTTDSVNTSMDTLNEMVDQTNNETQALPTISNEDAEITTISTKTEDNAVTTNESVTSEGTVTSEPSDITSEVTVTETDVKDSTDNISTSSDIPLPSSSA